MPAVAKPPEGEFRRTTGIRRRVLMKRVGGQTIGAGVSAWGEIGNVSIFAALKNHRHLHYLRSSRGIRDAADAYVFDMGSRKPNNAN